MQSPPLTRLEVAAVLRREVKRYVSLGVKQSVAIERVAQEQGLDPEWVAELVGFADGLAGGEA
jgi:hypothetical protein